MYSFLHIFRLSFVFGSIIVALVVPSRSDANNIKCSKGTTLKGEAPPKGVEQWCERGGKKHGPTFRTPQSSS